ncbi:CHAT domain-containing protein [Algoriphagus taiwanensis]|uniref:CHAT domain-containing protein n=1 Tax=Algoriphagus taiwanensis TaxID=1445656 RepID=A0ABQ6Q2L9_9BACT|nr:hypothetical protein Ataiwa_15340 [Algoriphagus taiwanensis]
MQRWLSSLFILLFCVQMEGFSQAFDAYLDSIDRGKKTNFSYNRKAASDFMEKVLIGGLGSETQLTQAFRAWTELTFFGRRYRELLEKGPSYLELFSQSPNRNLLQAEWSYFDYSSQVALTGKQDLAHLQSLVNRLSNFPQSRRVYGLSLDRLGRTYFDLNRYQEALTALKQADQIFSEMGFLLVSSSNRTVQGVVWDALEQFSASAEAYESSTQLLGLLDQKPYSTIAANSYNLGILYLDRLGDPFRALPYFKQALDSDRKDGGDSSFYLGDDYKMLSLAALKMGDLSQAEFQARRSVGHFQAIGQESSTQMASSKLQLALVLHHRKKSEESVKLAKQALEILERERRTKNTDVRRSKAQGFNQLGLYLSQLGDVVGAKAAFDQALSLADELGRDIFKIEALKGLIRLAMTQGNFPSARIYLSELDHILNSKFKDAASLQAESKLLHLELEQKEGRSNHVSWERSLDQLIEELVRLKSSRGLLLEAMRLKAVFLQTGTQDQNAASTFLNEVISQVETLKRDQTGLINSVSVLTEVKPLIEESLFLAWTFQGKEKDKSKVWGDLAIRLMEIQRKVVYEQGRGEELVKMWEEKDKRSWQITRQSLAEVRIKIAGIQQGQNSDKSKLLDWYEEEDSLLNLLSTIESKMKSPKESGLDSDVIQRILSDLKEGQGLISFFLGEESIFYWIGDSKGSSFGYLDHSADRILDLTSWVGQIKNPVRSGSLPDLWVEDWIPGFSSSYQSLTVVPDGLLCQVPFEVFKLKDQKPLIENTTVRYIPSFQVLQKRPIDHLEKDWMGFAPSYKLRSLPGNREEVTQLSRLTGGEAYFDSAASKANFLNKAPRAGLIHLAVHGELDGISPNFSRLWFGDEEEETLTALEIFEMPLDAELAVLSACNSGVGDEQFGNGLLSLAYSFMVAGTQSTVMSLWEVPDRETGILMEAFYQRLKEGNRKDEALRLAKLDYLSQVNDPALADPYFWAGFVILGDSEPVYSKSFAWIWISMILIILAVGMIWRQKRLREQSN